MDTVQDTTNKLFKKATGFSRGAVRGIAVGLLVLSVILVIVVSTTLVSFYTGWNFGGLIPSATNVVGGEKTLDTMNWVSLGTAVLGAVGLAVGAYAVGKLTGGDISIEDANLAAPLLAKEE